jgi:hypothetical protein
VERKRGPTNRNRISGDAVLGEWPKTHKALMTKKRRRRSGGRAWKGGVLIRGDLASRPKGRRRLSAEREVSISRSTRKGKGLTMRGVYDRYSRRSHAADVPAKGARRKRPG